MSELVSSFFPIPPQQRRKLSITLCQKKHHSLLPKKLLTLRSLNFESLITNEHDR